MRAVGLMLLAAFFAGCRQEPAQAPIRPVLFVSVAPYVNESLGRFAGTVQARYQSVLGFRVSGRIAKRLVEVGDRVAKGDLLAELDPTEQKSAVQASEATLAEVEAQYIRARDAAHRQQQLFNRGVGSKAQLEERLIQLSTIDTSLVRARSAVQHARDQLSYCRLYSDYEGVVTAWYVEEGQTVTAGQNVLTVAQPKLREAVFDIPTELAQRLSDDISFRVSAELMPNVSTTGRIRELAPQADANTRTRRVRLRLDEMPQMLRLGSSVSVRLSTTVARRAEVPASALLEREGRHQVWVIDPTQLTVAMRDVNVLARDGQKVIISAGLGAGERVVVAGVNSLQQGQRVKLQESAQ